MLTLNLLKFTDTKGWIHMAHKQDIQADTEEKASVGKELFQWVLVILGAVIVSDRYLCDRKRADPFRIHGKYDHDR